jgi:hypothetical protein
VIKHSSQTLWQIQGCPIVGWLLFLVFAGVGFVALPMDLVRSWWGRPHATIPRSEYITRAMDMARKAKSVKVICTNSNLRADDSAATQGRL